MNPFRAHTQYVQAQDAARQGGSHASMTGYNQMLLQLTEHRRRLKTASQMSARLSSNVSFFLLMPHGLPVCWMLMRQARTTWRCTS